MEIDDDNPFRYHSSLELDIYKTVYSFRRDNPSAVQEVSKERFQRLPIGNIPVMVRSSVCHLHNLSKEDIIKHGECPYDRGGYFIINGNEKVVISQERSATNAVYVFPSRQPLFDYTAEIRTCIDSFKNGTTVKIKHSFSIKDIKHHICITLPYSRQDVPVVVVFRAFGFTDRDLFRFICQGADDNEIVEIMKNCIEDVAIIKTKEDALDYIGKRCMVLVDDKNERIRIASNILRDIFSHIDPTNSTSESIVTKKAYFLGYMIHRLLLVVLNRRECDDRDHYANKHVEMVGSLLTSLFRTLFKKFTSDLKKELSKV